MFASVTGRDRRRWIVLSAFFMLAVLTGWLGLRTLRPALYWHAHQDEPIRGWMTIGYVAHSYHVPPHVLYQALRLPLRPHDRRPLMTVAREQHRTFDDVAASLRDAIVHARPPYPPPAPPAESAPPP